MVALAGQFPAPAKINLFLRITGRRADGYHELQTVFQFLDRGDTVSIRMRDDGELHLLTALDGVPPDADLTLRAARLLKERYPHTPGADISVIKRLPMGGGLGGGSSDAATVIVALNAMWQLGLPTPELAALGLSLGADVPVFIAGRACWAEGTGEIMTPLPELEEITVAVVSPGVRVCTAAVFGAKQLTRNCLPLTIHGFPLADGKRRAHELMAAGNVCESVVRGVYPGVGECLDWLAQFGPARMTGTGSACFCVLGEAAALPPPPVAEWRVFSAKTLNESPLRKAVETGPWKRSHAKRT
ncbi:MAG: 4-(cytidine 5'-diphospho)-2-C-methyl-D-erythritol kinase [Gammaproteobacteria bacterium]|nr:4-(cytidine 5'-diphospho)-2-C-methyl-D-erythritol kinase [Gammaproteobacteria bacterium]